MTVLSASVLDAQRPLKGEKKVKKSKSHGGHTRIYKEKKEKEVEKKSVVHKKKGKKQKKSVHTNTYVVRGRNNEYEAKKRE